MAMGDPQPCERCGRYPTPGGSCYCNITRESTHPANGQNSCDIGLSKWQLTDAHGWIMIDCPLDGGIIFSDEFLSALKAQLSEHETEEETES